MLILLIQIRWPRFGIKGSTVYKIMKIDKDVSENCPICLEEFKSYKKTSNKLNEPLLPNDTLMVMTPCHHEFHLSCLQNWMKHKYECPYCRRILPLSHEVHDDRQN